MTTETTEFPHGLNGYTNRGCRCPICRAANTKHHNEWSKWRPNPTTTIPLVRAPVGVKFDDDVIKGGSFSGRMVAIQDKLAGVWTTCKCGARDLANPRIVGKSRRINKCRECS